MAEAGGPVTIRHVVFGDVVALGKGGADRQLPVAATHSGTFMGIPATGKRVKIPYMDFWRVEDGRIKDNPVSVDLAFVLAQLGQDVFGGRGWETYDRGEVTPPRPDGHEGD